MKKRMSVLSRLHQRQPPVKSVRCFWKVVVDALQEIDSQDVPFALLYSVKDQNPKATELKTPPRDYTTPERLILEGAVGLDESSVEAGLLFGLAATVLCQEPQSLEPRVLPAGQNSPLGRILQNVAFNSRQLADKAMVCPIFSHDTNVTGFIVLGMNSWTDDEDFRMFAQILADSVSKSISSIILLIRLRDVQDASEGLLRRVEEAERSNFMFRHMAESATVGCAIFNPSGRPLWLNEAYLNLTGVAREDFRPGIWQKAIVPEDLPKVEGRWNELASGKPIVPFTFRVKRHHDAKAKPGSYESLDHRWLLSNAYVDFDEDGSSRRVMGWLTDISAQKWSERLQAQRLEDALETKRQTEKFIDMVRIVLSGFRDSIDRANLGFS
jgi:PAS domain S-box-containing protein